MSAFLLAKSLRFVAVEINLIDADSVAGSDGSESESSCPSFPRSTETDNLDAVVVRDGDAELADLLDELGDEYPEGKIWHSWSKFVI